MNYDPFREAHSCIEEKLPYCFAGSSGVVERHVRIAAADYGVLYSAEPELQTFAASTVDMTAT